TAHRSRLRCEPRIDWTAHAITGRATGSLLAAPSMCRDRIENLAVPSVPSGPHNSIILLAQARIVVSRSPPTRRELSSLSFAMPPMKVRPLWDRCDPSGYHVTLAATCPGAGSPPKPPTWLGITLRKMIWPLAGFIG